MFKKIMCMCLSVVPRIYFIALIGHLSLTIQASYKSQRRHKWYTHLKRRQITVESWCRVKSKWKGGTKVFLLSTLEKEIDLSANNWCVSGCGVSSCNTGTPQSSEKESNTATLNNIDESLI